jgi:hypothetical protein
MLRNRTGEIQETHTADPRIHKYYSVGPEKSRRPTQQAREFATTHAYMHFFLIACGSRHVHVRSDRPATATTSDANPVDKMCLDSPVVRLVLLISTDRKLHKMCR